MTDTRHHAATVFRSEEDDGFIALSPDLPGCSAFGETQGEAIDELQDAVAARIEAATSAGHVVPPPSQPSLRLSA